MAEKRTTSDMVGEIMREAGVLFVVFGIIDGAANWQTLRNLGFTVTIYSVVVLLLASMLLAVGIMVERRRSP